MISRMSLSTAIVLCAAIGGYPEEVAAAQADYAARAARGECPRYLHLGALPGEQREEAAVAISFWLPHLSLGSVLEHQVPQQLGETSLWRIDLDLIGWGRQRWIELAREYPYIPDHWVDPLIIRGDWLLAVTSDADRSKSYYTLLYGAPPADRGEFLKQHGIAAGDIKRFRTGVVLDHGRSGVADDTRLWTHTPIAAGSFTETFDSRDAFGVNDPLEQLGGGLKFDASEAIVTIPKVRLRTGERGAALAYWLTNGAQKRIDKAETNIVVDHTQFRGDPTIRTPGSCVSCHLGLNGPSHNLLRDLIAEGLELTAKKNQVREFLEHFYLSKQTTVVSRAGEDFAAFCAQAAGVQPSACLAAYRDVIHFYDRPLGLAQAAREVAAVNADELRNALAYHSERIGPVSAARLSGLAHDSPVPRKSWEGDRATHQLGIYHAVVAALTAWRTR